MKLVTRAAWGAKPFTCSSPIPPIDNLVVHYSAADADEQADHANCAARVRGIQNFHMSSTPSDPTKPWCDIAYNFIFCKHGYVFEGRGWDRKSGATGAANSHTVAICFLGDDTAGSDDVTFAGREALGQWIRKSKGHYDGPQGLKGHRDYMDTSCPGNQLYAWIQTDAWKTISAPRIRFELWARQKDEKGKWQPFIAAKTDSFPAKDAPKRSTGFVTNHLALIAKLAVRHQNPRIRRVEV